MVEIVRPPRDFENVIFASRTGFLVEGDGFVQGAFADVAPLSRKTSSALHLISMGVKTGTSIYHTNNIRDHLNLHSNHSGEQKQVLGRE